MKPKLMVLCLTFQLMLPCCQRENQTSSLPDCQYAKDNTQVTLIVEASTAQDLAKIQAAFPQALFCSGLTAKGKVTTEIIEVGVYAEKSGEAALKKLSGIGYGKDKAYLISGWPGA